LTASINNEEVGEGVNDTAVMGLEIDASSNSDLTISAVKLVFLEGTATSNFDNYAKDVSIWLGTTEVGRVSSSVFTDDNDWTNTLSLSNAKVSAGTTGILYVKASGVTNIDTADAGDTWTADITSVRWVDGTGALISEDPATAVRTFSFETAATAGNLEFKISEDLASVNDAHVIDVHATDDTNDVQVLSFKVQILGDSNVKLKSLPVNFDVTTAANVEDMINGLSLWMDGTEIGSSNMSTDCIEDGDPCTTVGPDETYFFDDLNTTMTPGYHSFLVKADFLSIADALNAGDALQATFGETQTDLAEFDAEDSTATNLVDADKTGDATSDALEVRDIGISFALVSRTAAITFNADPATAGSADVGTYTNKFNLTAFGGDVTIDRSCGEDNDSGADIDAVVDGNDGTADNDEGVAFTVTNSGSNTTACSFTSTAEDNPGDTGDSWLLRDGQTKEFTLTVAATATADHFAKVYLDSINWDDLTTDTVPDLFFNAGLGETKTSTGELYLSFI